MKKSIALVLMSALLLALGIAAGDMIRKTGAVKGSVSDTARLITKHAGIAGSEFQKDDPWSIFRGNVEGSKVEPFIFSKRPAHQLTLNSMQERIQAANGELQTAIRQNGDVSGARQRLDELASQLPRLQTKNPQKTLSAELTGSASTGGTSQQGDKISTAAADPTKPIQNNPHVSGSTSTTPRDAEYRLRRQRDVETPFNQRNDASTSASLSQKAERIDHTFSDAPVLSTAATAPQEIQSETTLYNHQPVVTFPAGDALDAEGEALPPLPPMDPVQRQINELLELRKTTELEGGDFTAIDAQLDELLGRRNTGTLDNNGGVTFNSAHGPINVPHNSCAEGSITVSNLGAQILDVEVQIDTLTYDWSISFVDVYLISPAGDTCTLSTGNGGTGRYYYNTRFDDDAATSITAGVSPFTGSYRPEEPLTVFDGENPNGIWRMRVCQNEDNSCYLRRWRIQILAATPGDSCGNALALSIPGVHSGNTCTAFDHYYYACPYTQTGAQDLVYSYSATASQLVTFSLCRSGYDTKLMIYDETCTGTPIACNDDANPCPGETGSYRSLIECQPLQAGHTYYVVVDGYTSGSCGDFFLETGICASCTVQAQTEDIIECAEIPDSSHARLDCDGGDNNVTNGGTAAYGAIACGQTIMGECFTYIRNRSVYRDTDFYRFTLNQPESIGINLISEFNASIFVLDSATPYILYEGSATACEAFSDTVPNLAAGHYILFVAPLNFIGVPVPADYRIALSCLSFRPGRDCGNAIVLSNIVTRGNQTNCGLINDYSNTCLASYDGGEDILYRWIVSEPGDYTIWMNPRSVSYSGILLDDDCPPSPSACLGINASSSSLPHGINCITLPADTYYIMVDTWPDPTCIPSFDLMTGYCYPNCVTSQPGDIEECAESPDTSHNRIDCNGGCNNSFAGGVEFWGAISSGQTIFGRSFTYASGAGGQSTRDTDFYLFTVTEQDCVFIRAQVEFPAVMAICDTATCTILAYTFSDENCDSLQLQTTLASGTYAVFMATRWFNGMPLESHYRLSLHTAAWEPFTGSDCADPVVQQGAGILFDESTCFTYNDYSATCIDQFDEGEDRIYRFEIPEPGNWAIWLDPHGTTYSGLAIDESCPPDLDCWAVSNDIDPIGQPHGLLSLYLTSTQYNVIVDKAIWDLNSCIPTYDLYFQENCVISQMGDIFECHEVYDSTHAADDCNGGCRNIYWGGTASYGSLTSGDTAAGMLFQYWRDGNRQTDIDQYLFTITEAETIRVTVHSSVPFEVGIKDTNSCITETLLMWGERLAYCDSTILEMPCLEPGTYAVYITGAYETIFAPGRYRMALEYSATACLPAVGRDCANSHSIYAGMTLASQSTCPMGADYGNTCLGLYDDGADIIYYWNLTEAGDYYLWMDPHDSYYTGFVLDDQCPPSPDACIAFRQNWSSSPYGTECIHLEAGDYYIMVDTWPYPYCIPQFDLSIAACGDSCVVCEPGDVIECAETTDSSHAANDCNGGCNNQTAGGINYYGSIASGETVCGKAFTYVRDGGNFRDTDWYPFVLSRAETIRVTAVTEFPAMVAIVDTVSDCNQTVIVAMAFTDSCDTMELVIDSLWAGEHFLWIGPDIYGGIPIPMDYRMTFTTIPHTSGNDCATAREITDETTLTNLTTCGKINDYDSTCLEGSDNGEDMIFQWTVTTGGMYTVWLNPYDAWATGIVVDDQCPPRYENCIASHESWADIEHGVCIDLEPGTYFIMVDTHPSTPCIPQFDLTISSSAVPPNDLCENAIPIGTPSTTYGSTKCATVDPAPHCWEDPPYFPGVWYTVVGTGNTMTADICSSDVQWDNRISIYTCGCDSLVCVAAEGDLCSDTARLRPVSWCSRPGETYWILVHGLWGSSGDFRLDIYDDGTPCPFGLRCPCWNRTLAAPEVIDGYTIGVDNTCSASSSPDEVVRVEIPSAGYWNFSLCGSDFDTYLLIGTDCCQYDAATADDYFCNGEYGAQSNVCLYLPAPGYYYATIEGRGGPGAESGYFVLNVQPSDGFVPAQVTGVTASEDQCGAVVVTWNDVPGEDGYAIWANTQYWWVVPADCTQTVDTYITPGDGHHYTVIAVSACGVAPASAADYGMAWDLVDPVQNLAATDTGCDSIYLTWDDVGYEDEYRIYRGGSLIGTQGSNVTHFSDTSAPGTYSFSVSAYNGICGEGSASEGESGTRLSMPTEGTNLTASTTYCDRVDLNWTDADYETSYLIYRDLVQMDTVLPANTTSYSDCTAVPGVSHSYGINANNSCGSRQTSAVGLRLPTPAQAASVIASDTLCSYVHITWSDITGETGFQISRNGTVIADNLEMNTTSYDDTSSLSGAEYSYAVRAFNEGCSGSWSVPDSGRRRTPPMQAPTAYIPDSCQSFTVCWSNVPNADGYRLYHNSTLIDTVPSGTLCMSFTTLPQNALFRVSAFNTCGEGPPSGWIIIGFPVVPSVGSFIASDSLCDGVHLNWTVEGEADSCAIYRNGVLLIWTTTNSYIDVSAAAFVAYSYYIIGRDECGSGLPSLSDNGLRLDVPPQVPGVTATQDRCDSVIVQWTDVMYEAGYQIFIDGEPTGTTIADVVRFAEVPTSGSHLYTVRATNSCGPGLLSAQATGILLDGPGIPSSITASDDQCGSVVIWWGDATGDVDAYRFYRDGLFIGGASAAAESYVDSPITGSHSYAVAAYSNECGQSESSNPDSGTGHEVPGTPGNPQFLTPAVCDSIRIEWTAAAGEVTQYYIRRDSALLDSTPLTHFTDHTADDAHEHSYTVAAFNPYCGSGSVSNPVFGHARTLMDVTTPLPDTIASGQWLALDLVFCANTDSAQFFLSPNGGPYLFLRTIQPSEWDSVFLDPIPVSIPNCQLLAVIRRDLREDSLISPPFFLEAAQAAANLPAGVPADFFLDRNYPNPFNPSTTIRFGVPVSADVRIEIFDLLGRRVAVVLDSRVVPGVHHVVWDCSTCPSGMYVVRMQSGTRTLLGKMLLMK